MHLSPLAIIMSLQWDTDKPSQPFEVNSRKLSTMPYWASGSHSAVIRCDWTILPLLASPTTFLDLGEAHPFWTALLKQGLLCANFHPPTVSVSTDEACCSNKEIETSVLTWQVLLSSWEKPGCSRSPPPMRLTLLSCFSCTRCHSVNFCNHHRWRQDMSLVMAYHTPLGGIQHLLSCPPCLRSPKQIQGQAFPSTWDTGESQKDKRMSMQHHHLTCLSLMSALGIWSTAQPYYMGGREGCQGFQQFV